MGRSYYVLRATCYVQLLVHVPRSTCDVLTRRAMCWGDVRRGRATCDVRRADSYRRSLVRDAEPATREPPNPRTCELRLRLPPAIARERKAGTRALPGARDNIHKFGPE